MKLSLPADAPKDAIFRQVQMYLDGQGLRVTSKDFTRPWGGFLVIDESQAAQFATHFFPEVALSDLKIGGKLSPKILMVQPSMRLSWQYHHRRGEIWKLVAGVAGVMTSDSDEQGKVKTLQVGEVVRLKQGMRHRLVGLAGWGIISEIWQHSDPKSPSDEDDIVRLNDDFGR